MRALQIVDAKIVRSDPEHPVASYWAGEILEGPAAEMQVALGHAYALPEPPAIPEAGEAAVPEAQAALPAPAEVASGGPVSPAGLYLIGETGPETINPTDGSGA